MTIVDSQRLFYSTIWVTTIQGSTQDSTQDSIQDSTWGLYLHSGIYF